MVSACFWLLSCNRSHSCVCHAAVASAPTLKNGKATTPLIQTPTNWRQPASQTRWAVCVVFCALNMRLQCGSCSACLGKCENDICNGLCAGGAGPAAGNHAIVAASVTSLELRKQICDSPCCLCFAVWWLLGLHRRLQRLPVQRCVRRPQPDQSRLVLRHVSSGLLRYDVISSCCVRLQCGTCTRCCGGCSGDHWSASVFVVVCF